MTEGEGRLAEAAAKGVIAKAVKSLVRDAEDVAAKDAARDAATDAGRDMASDAGRDAAHHVDLDSLPDYHSGGQPDLFGSVNVPADYKPYGDLSRQEFYDEHYNAEKGHWDYPENDGFAGTPHPNTLQPGQVIDRYGFDTGNYTSPADTPFDQRALPPTSLTQPYYRYEVLRPLPDTVTEGPIEPAFEQRGGGVQHFFSDHDINWYVQNGYLKQVYP